MSSHQWQLEITFPGATQKKGLKKMQPSHPSFLPVDCKQNINWAGKKRMLK